MKESVKCLQITTVANSSLAACWGAIQRDINEPTQHDAFAEARRQNAEGKRGLKGLDADFKIATHPWGM